MLTLVISLLTFVEVLAAFLLIGIILIQQTKAGGGLGAMAGGATETVFGATAGNVLTKATIILAAIFLGTTLVVAALTGWFHRPNRSVAEDVPAAQEEMAVPSAPDADAGAGAPAVDDGATAPPADADAAAGDQPAAPAGADDPADPAPAAE